MIRRNRGVYILANPIPKSIPMPNDPDLVPGMPYRHYKGGAYRVTGLGRFEADLAPVVVYESMRDRSILWVRTAEVFTEPVRTDAGEMPRFAPDWPAALARLDFLPRQTVLQALAVLFHDAVYVPGCEHNEAASAALIETMVDEVDDDVLRRAMQIVLDTCTHTPTTPDAATVLDLDLYRLAAPAEAFDAYTAAG